MMTKVCKYETRKRTGKFILNACAALALPLMVSVSVLVYKNIAPQKNSWTILAGRQ